MNGDDEKIMESIFDQMNELAKRSPIHFITPKANDVKEPKPDSISGFFTDYQKSFHYQVLEPNFIPGRQTGKAILFLKSFSDKFNKSAEIMSELSYDPQSYLIDMNIRYEGSHICPITRKEYAVQPFFNEQLTDIDDFIYAVRNQVKFSYENSFLYKDENEYSCISFSDLLQVEKEYRKRWSKFTKKRKSPDKYDRSRLTRYRLKNRCWKVKELIKDYKYYFHLKYLRGLFVKNKGNRITYRITQDEFGETHFPTTVITLD